MSPQIFDTEQMQVDTFATGAALRYSTYVIGSRTVPHVGDGLKPVHRRILFSMHELGLRPDAMFKKSARTVGDALGKYHPHGDSACYEAMVLMAQPFAMRVPMIDGQGNWGSIADPHSFAAMRYTESKMTGYSSMMMSELKQDTVDWTVNYDESMKEPAVLPARLPNLLINGVSAIAWGFAVYIPSHNPGEIFAACQHFLQDPSASDDALLSHIHGPDFSRGGHIANSPDEIKSVYKSGRGTLKNRGTYMIDGDALIITSIPKDASLDKIVQQISTEVEREKLPVIAINEEIKDSSIRLTLTMKSRNTDAHALMLHFFATTDLEKTIKIMPYAIAEDLRLKQYNIPALVRDWCIFRENTVKKRLTHRISQIEKRLHLLQAYRKVFDALDLVISIIRHHDEPKAALMSEILLTDIQAQAVMEMQLRHLAKLELQNITKEMLELERELSQIQHVLSSEKRLKSKVLKELEIDAKPYLTPRLTTIGVCAVAKKFETPVSDNAVSELTVIVSKSWWIRSQKGHQVDHNALAFKAGDSLRMALQVQASTPLLFMDKTGRFYSILASECPSGRGVGEPVHAGDRLLITDTGQLHTMVPFVENSQMLLATAQGLGFITPSDSLVTRNRKGKEVLRITHGDRPIDPAILTDESHVALLTKRGKLLIIARGEINVSAKSQGICLIKIHSPDFADGSDELVQVLPLHNDSSLTLHLLKKKPVTLAPAKWLELVGARARKGTSFDGTCALSATTPKREPT